MVVDVAAVVKDLAHQLAGVSVGSRVYVVWPKDPPRIHTISETAEVRGVNEGVALVRSTRGPTYGHFDLKTGAICYLNTGPGSNAYILPHTDAGQKAVEDLKAENQTRIDEARKLEGERVDRAVTWLVSKATRQQIIDQVDRDVLERIGRQLAEGSLG